MICGLEGRETGEGAAAGAGGGTGTCRGRSGKLRGARGDGCPVRGPSGSAAAEPLGLTAGPEPQRSGGGGGLTILPRGPVPSNRHRPRCGSAGGSSLTFLAGGASARCPGPGGGGGGGGGDVGRGGREGGRLDLQRQQEKGTGEGGGAAGAGATAARATFRYPRWVPVNAPFSLLLSISPGG
ncbi:glycine-rich protein DOT1-like [Rhinopithecus roxellana]|uniref:glycine-rich protein DOT1-like n=1 Tax=Rhinopithecus roxellana TaxID=61622 RepID=UPI00123732DB|nr:glycine-rich protein DOT1-like [Rhinopithecus roxellana]